VLLSVRLSVKSGARDGNFFSHPVSATKQNKIVCPAQRRRLLELECLAFSVVPLDALPAWHALPKTMMIFFLIIRKKTMMIDEYASLDLDRTSTIRGTGRGVCFALAMNGECLALPLRLWHGGRQHPPSSKHLFFWGLGVWGARSLAASEWR